MNFLPAFLVAFCIHFRTSKLGKDRNSPGRVRNEFTVKRHLIQWIFCKIFSEEEIFAFCELSILGSNEDL